MRLRKPCEHNFYDAHEDWIPKDDSWLICPGGEFLADDALVIDYCPVHKSLFDPKDRIDCHLKLSWLRAESPSHASLWRSPCEWWTGQLIELKKVYPDALTVREGAE